MCINAFEQFPQGLSGNVVKGGIENSKTEESNFLNTKLTNK